MSPPIFRLTPLVATLQLFSAAAAAETLSYFASPDAAQASLSFNTNCAVNDLNFNKAARTLTCPGGSLPPEPICSSFGAVNLTLSPNATPARVVDARRGDSLLFTGTCAVGAGSTSEAPLGFQLLPGDGETPVATSQISAQFAVRVASDAAFGSLVPYRLRAEQAGAVSPSITAAYKVVEAVIEPPTNCALTTQPFVWTTGTNSPAVSVAGCSGLTGSQAYRWFADGAVQAGQVSATLPAGALNGLAAGSHTVSARVCNDPGQADTGGSTCATPSASAVVNAPNVTPTPSNCIIQPSHPSPVASATVVTFSLSGCVNTGGTGYTTSYSWTRDSVNFGSNASAASTFNNSGTTESSSTVAVQVCNTPSGGGTAVCHSPSPSTTVRVTPGGNTGGINCEGKIAGITRTISRDVDLNTISPYESDWIDNGNDTAIVVAFRTRNQTGTGQGQVWAGNQANNGKLVVLSTSACANYNEPGVIGYLAGTGAASVAFSVGTGTIPVLTPNTVYYFTVTSRMWGNGGYNLNSCGTGYTCPAKVGVVSP